MIATGLSQAQLLVLEKPGNALPSPISLPTQGLTFIEGLTRYEAWVESRTRTLRTNATPLATDTLTGFRFSKLK